jgi:hypothetical protein
VTGISWSRLVQLTGVVFAVLVVVAVASGSGETPGGDASPTKVIAYYARHRSAIETSSILLVLAFVFEVLWAGSLLAFLRRSSEARALGPLVLAGAVLMAAGAATIGGLEYGLAHQIYHLQPQAAQTVSFLSNELFLALLIGITVFGLTSGIAILRSALLPSWLGWTAVVFGAAALVPPAAYLALIAFVLWTATASALLYLRYDDARRQPLLPRV